MTDRAQQLARLRAERTDETSWQPEELDYTGRLGSCPACGAVARHDPACLLRSKRWQPAQFRAARDGLD